MILRAQRSGLIPALGQRITFARTPSQGEPGRLRACHASPA